MRTDTEDTIAAIATPPGRSALGIVRISGSRCRAILPEVFQPRHEGEIPAFRPVLGRIFLDNQQFLDEALVTFYQGPHSYTREDLAEISCHGNPLILEKVLARVVSAGARLAIPGEFTFRAFLNGRLDLVQAEAVQDLIQSDSVGQLGMAIDQLEGRLSRILTSFRAEVIELVALLEGNIDFSEEQHYEFTNREDALRRLDALIRRVRELLGTFERGRVIRDGYTVAIVGRPNVGKSSIFNNLLGEDRAIVAATPGTTRDFLREKIRLGNFVVNLLDTAGIRSSQEEVEQEGIQRSRRMMEKADLVILVLDGSEPLQDEDKALIREMSGRDVLLACNKADKTGFTEHRPTEWPVNALSALSGDGVDELLDQVRVRIDERTKSHAQDAMISSLRHRDLLQSALSGLMRAQSSVAAGASEEMVLVGLHEALQHVGELTGAVTINDLYDHIFSNFCIGK